MGTCPARVISRRGHSWQSAWLCPLRGHVSGLGGGKLALGDGGPYCWGPCLFLQLRQCAQGVRSRKPGLLSSGLSGPRFPGSGAAAGRAGEHQGPSKPGLQVGLAGGRHECSSCRRPACSVGLARWLPCPPCLCSAPFCFSCTRHCRLVYSPSSLTVVTAV